MLDLSTVRPRLAALARADTGFALFGASHHRYELGPAVELDRLAELEERLGVGLPDGYRSFLSEVGNGGAGPGYGLVPVEKAVSYVEGDLRRELDLAPEATVPTKLAAVDFPLDRPLLGPEQLEDWSGPRLNRGVLLLGGYGCGTDPHLVVSGSRRGEVWIDDTSSDGGFYPFTVFDSGHMHDPRRGYPETFEATLFDLPLTFAAWYTDWLQSAEEQALGRDLGL